MGQHNTEMHDSSKENNVDDLSNAFLEQLSLKKSADKASDENDEQYIKATLDKQDTLETKVTATSKELNVENKTTNAKPAGNSSDADDSDEDNEQAGDEGSDDDNDGEEYQERGPCKAPRSHYMSNRYNPITGEQDELFVDPCPQLIGTQSGPQYPCYPGYDTPVYSSPAYDTPSSSATSHEYLNGGGSSYQQQYSPVLSEGIKSNNTSPDYAYSPYNAVEGSPFSLGTDVDDLDALEAVTQQLRGGLLSSNYLDAFEDAVAKTVNGKDNLFSSSSSEGEDDSYSLSSSSSVQHIMDGLRSIDPTELDYIAPATPVHHDLEEELALSEFNDRLEDQYPVTPPLSPLSPNMGGPCIPSPGGYASKKSKSGSGVVGKKAVSTIKKLCNEDVVLQAIKRVACQRNEDLCQKDPDGDTCFMIVVCKPSESTNFYENLFVLQQHLQKIKVCCDQPLGREMESCSLCGATSKQWRTPLSEKNNAGDSVLSCAAKMRHPERVINYLVTGLAQCQADVERVFDFEGRQILAPYAGLYPVLKRFL